MIKTKTKKGAPSQHSYSDKPTATVFRQHTRSTTRDGIGSTLIPASEIRTTEALKVSGRIADSTCLACKKVPIIVPLSRSPRLDGFCGPDGYLSTVTPRDSPDSIPGSGRIAVGQTDGSHQPYTSKYPIELINFQVHMKTTV